MRGQPGNIEAVREEPDGFGILLPVVKFAPPVSQAFAGEEYEERIRFHSERVQKEMEQLEQARIAELAALVSAPRTAWKDNRPLYLKINRLPDGRRAEELRLLACAECGKTLLGESEEFLRVLPLGATKRMRRFVASLPPGIAGRLDGRPYCEECL